MNKYEKAQYDFKAVRETMKESHHVHKEIAIELLNSLEKKHLELLTPPTADDVCKALSEYYGDEWMVYDEEEGEFKFESNNTICYLFKEQNNQVLRVKFEAFLPPHLITMIGRFYEDEKK